MLDISTVLTRKEVISETGSKYALCFEFQDTTDDNFLILSYNSPNTVQNTCSTPWYKDETTLAQLEAKINNFTDLVAANVERNGIALVMIYCNLARARVVPEVGSVTLYCSCTEKDNFCTINTPNKPYELKATHTEKHIKLTWNILAPSNKSEKCTSFSVAYHDEEDSLDNWTSQIIENDKVCIRNGDIIRCTVEVCNLQIDRTYVFKVFAEYECYRSIGSDKSNPCFIPAPGKVISRPCTPEAPKVSSVYPTSICLRWEKPQKSEVENYIVYYRSMRNSGWSYWNQLETKTSSTLFKVDNLSCSLGYKFKIVANYKDILSKESNESEILTIKECIPSKPGKAKAIASSCDSITLAWDEPEHNANLIIHYIIMYCSDNQHQMRSFKNEIVIEQLKPNTNYKFTVVARGNYSISESSTPSDICTNAADIQCSTPGKPITEASESSMIICWTKPLLHYELVSSYSLSCINNQKVVKTWTIKNNETKHKVTADDIGCSEFTFFVFAKIAKTTQYLALVKPVIL